MPSSTKINYVLIDYIFGVVLFTVITFILAPPIKSIFEITDLSEFYCGARLLVEGRAADIYDPKVFFPFQQSVFPALGTRAIPLYVAPFGLYFLIPLLVFPPAIAYLGTKICYIILCLTALCFLVRHLQLSSRWFMWLGAILPFSGPFWEAIRIEQVAPILFLSMVLHLVLLDKNRPVSSALALAPFLMKPHLALTLCCLHLGARRWKFVLSFALIALFFLALSYFTCGPQAYQKYQALLSFSMVDLQWMNPEATPTLRGQLLRLSFIPQALSTKITTVVFGVILLAIIYLGQRLRGNVPSRVASLVAIPLGLVFSLHCYSYDLVVLLPAVLMCGQEFVSALLAWRRDKVKPDVAFVADFVLAKLVPLLGFVLPFYALIHYIFTLRGSLTNYHFVLLLLLTVSLVRSGLTDKVKAGSENTLAPPT